MLIKVTYSDLELFRAHLEQTPNKFGNIPKAASVNRVLSCLRHMMGKAVQWGMIRRNPFNEGDKLHRKENNESKRYLSEAEIPLLLNQCRGYLHDIVECALLSGMRKGELLSLKWGADSKRPDLSDAHESRQEPSNPDHSRP